MKFLLSFLFLLLSVQAQAQFPDKILELEYYTPWTIVDQFIDGAMVYEKLTSGEDFAYRAFHREGTRFYSGNIQMIYASIDDTLYVTHNGLQRWIIPPETYQIWLDKRKAFADLESVQALFATIFVHLKAAAFTPDWEPTPQSCDPWTGDFCSEEQKAIVDQCQKDAISVQDCVNQNPILLE